MCYKIGENRACEWIEVVELRAMELKEMAKKYMNMKHLEAALDDAFIAG